MPVTSETAEPQYWLVGAQWGDDGDQTDRFLAEGVWENGYTDRYLEMVASIRPGDKIAIKAAYTRKHGLPFDNRGHTVSVISIKATGTVVENPGDGRRVVVDWTPERKPREWYFYTHRGVIWRVSPGEWMADGLLAFVFRGTPQDLDRFRNEPHFRERFGTLHVRKRFEWTAFYEAIATALLAHREDRTRLVAFLKDLSQRHPAMNYLGGDQYADGGSGFVRDICPFTTIGLFTRGITTDNRRALAGELARFLGVTEAVPTSFEGVPRLFQMKSWFFPRERDRDASHITALWNVFAAAIAFADTEDDHARARFVAAFDDAARRPIVSWNLTMGLYWSRPWTFASLDKNSREYITGDLRIPLGTRGKEELGSASEYIALLGALKARFDEADYPVHSFPELAFEAVRRQSEQPAEPGADDDEAGDSEHVDVAHAAEAMPAHAPIIPYGPDDIRNDGCFLERAEIDHLIRRLRDKKNLILQGPPGTGKTWLAKRLAYALVGYRDDSCLRVVQFHPTLSYEDFVRGWRPASDGRLVVADGAFMDAITAALAKPGARHVVVIEEINRGNPAQVFGELLTLLEAGKRSPKDAIELCYPDADGQRRPVHVPENLFVIGTMNIADRSLALVDFALRRRFAFANLEPRLGESWRRWVVDRCNLDLSLALEIERRITALNERIANDARLGPQFRIGHSYVTPPHALEPESTRQWFREVARSEIRPLLEEYWFDAPDEARAACDALEHDW